MRVKGNASLLCSDRKCVICGHPFYKRMLCRFHWRNWRRYNCTVDYDSYIALAVKRPGQCSGCGEEIASRFRGLCRKCEPPKQTPRTVLVMGKVKNLRDVTCRTCKITFTTYESSVRC